jgi:hypothetical protein
MAAVMSDTPRTDAQGAMSDPDICGACGLFIRGPDVQGDACPGHDNPEIAPNGVPYRDMWAGGVGAAKSVERGDNRQRIEDEALALPSLHDLRDAVKLPADSSTHIENLEKCYADARQLLVRFNEVLHKEIERLDEMVMRWFKAASPYATPGSLEEGLKTLRGESDALRAAVDSWRRLRTVACLCPKCGVEHGGLSEAQ